MDYVGQFKNNIMTHSFKFTVDELTKALYEYALKHDDNIRNKVNQAGGSRSQFSMTIQDGDIKSINLEIEPQKP